MKCQQNRYKDKCDKCGKFDYLKGINNQCLCPDCRNELDDATDINVATIVKEEQLTLFDFGEDKKITKLTPKKCYNV